MSLIPKSRRLALAIVVAGCSPSLAGAEVFQWSPPVGSDSQWTNPLNWESAGGGGAPTSSDIAIFTQLAQPAESAVAKGDPDPVSGMPTSTLLSVGGIAVHGFHAYDGGGNGTDDWRLELARFSADPGNPSNVLATPFRLDLDAGNGALTVGQFVAPTVFGDPAIAIPGGLTVTGRSVFQSTIQSAAVGFRGVVDVRHGRLTFQDVNYDGEDKQSTLSGLVDSRDDLSYIPQRLPTAELFVDNSRFDAFKTRGLLIGSIGKAAATFSSGSVLANLKELRVGGNVALGQESHERSTLTLVDSSFTVGDGAGGGVYIGDDAAPDLIDTYNGTMTMTRSSLSPSAIRDSEGAVIGYEPLDVRVGHFGLGRLQMEDNSTLSATRLFVGEQLLSFGEFRATSSQVTLATPLTETANHEGRLNVGRQGLGFMVVTGTTTAPSSVTARSLVLGENQNAYGDLYLDRNTTFTLTDSAAIGVSGQGRLTVTGRFTGVDDTLQRNLYANSLATIGIRPISPATDPTRSYTVTVGQVWASAGFLVVGEGARLDVTDQPLAGSDELDEFGVERWRGTTHKMVVGDDGLGWMTVHADAMARTEQLIVGQTPLGVGHVVLNKVMLNPSGANTSYAVPGTVRVSQSAVIGGRGMGTLTVRGPYVPRAGIEPDTFDTFGFLTASMTIGDQLGSSGTVRLINGGQLVVDGTVAGERDLVIAREGAAYLDVSDTLQIGPSNNYIGGGTGGTLRVPAAITRIGGADTHSHPAAKGTVVVNANGRMDIDQLLIGSATSTGDILLVRAGATANVALPGGGSELRTFAGGTVHARRVEVRGDSTVAIESSPLAMPADPLRDGAFRVDEGLDLHGGTLRLGNLERTQTGYLNGSVNLLGGRLIGNGTVEGDVAIDGGTVQLQINGTTRHASYDAVDVTGAVTFTAGSIQIVAGSFVGQIGQQFDIIRFGSALRVNSFDVVNPLASQPGTQWVSYLDSDSYTLAVAGATGDTNFDGAVNFDDLLILAQNYAGPGLANWTTGDFNDDQVVNFDDLLVLAQNYGSSLLGEVHGVTGSFEGDWALAQALAPEPASLGVVAAAAVSIRRRRR